MRAIQKAQFLSHIYLLFVGMWRGQCEFRAEDRDGKLSLIAVGTGSLSKGTVKLARIFYNPTGKTQTDVENALNSWGWEQKRGT